MEETKHEMTPEVMEAARENPNGWVYKIEGTFGSDQQVPPEAIVGAWKVNSQGNLTGEFLSNPRYTPSFSKAEPAKTSDVELVVVTVRQNGHIRWFRCDRDWWIMDVSRWHDEFAHRGRDVLKFNDNYRFGLKVVNEDNADKFLECLKDYEVESETLAMELALRYRNASSWWDGRLVSHHVC